MLCIQLLVQTDVRSMLCFDSVDALISLAKHKSLADNDCSVDYLEAFEGHNMIGDVEYVCAPKSASH